MLCPLCTHYVGILFSPDQTSVLDEINAAIEGIVGVVQQVRTDKHHIMQFVAKRVERIARVCVCVCVCVCVRTDPSSHPDACVRSLLRGQARYHQRTKRHPQHTAVPGKR